MKIASLIGISLSAFAVAQELRKDPRLDIIYLSSVNAPPTDLFGVERDIITYWRNTYMLPAMEAWMYYLNATWTWWVYGECNVGPCVYEMGKWDHYALFARHSLDVGYNLPTDLTANGTNLAGWDVATWAMGRPLDPEYDIRYVIWENRALEPINVAPYPPTIDVNENCGEGNFGHVSNEQFRSAFPDQNHRIYFMNYESEERMREYEALCKSIDSKIMMNVGGIPASYDVDDVWGHIGPTWGKDTAWKLFLFLARGKVNTKEYVPESEIELAFSTDISLAAKHLAAKQNSFSRERHPLSN